MSNIEFLWVVEVVFMVIFMSNATTVEEFFFTISIRQKEKVHTSNLVKQKDKNWDWASSSYTQHTSCDLRALAEFD